MHPLAIAWLSPLLAASLLAQADVSRISLQVQRDDNAIVGALANFSVLVNDAKVGSIADGEQGSFSVPVSESGIYFVRFGIGSGKGTGIAVRAKPGEHVHCAVGMGWFDSQPVARDGRVVPLHDLRLHVAVDEPTVVRVDDFAVELRNSGQIRLPHRIPVGSVHRTRIHVGDASWPVFTSPLHAPYVGLASHAANDCSARTQSFLYQIELARAWHFQGMAADVSPRVAAFVEDLRRLPAGGLPEFALSAREAEIARVERLAALARESVWQDAATNCLFALGCLGLQAVLTGSVSGLDVAAESVGAVVETAWSALVRDSEMQRLQQEATTTRARAWTSAISATATNSGTAATALAEWRLRTWLLGDWSYVFPLTGERVVYRFHFDGRLEEIHANGSIGSGTYTVDGHRVRVRWPSGSEETAACTAQRDGSMVYEIEAHTGDPQQVGLKIPMRRQ